VRLLEGANLTLRFLLELSAIAIMAYWGFKSGSGAMRWLLAIVAPSVVIAVWALFVSPNATIAVPRLAQLAIEFVVWAAAAGALAATGHRTLAVVLAVVAILSGTLNHLRE
jgi:hypothetical protein